MQMMSQSPSFYLHYFAPGKLQVKVKYTVDAGSQQHVTSVHQEAINSCNTNEKAIYVCNELRKKGLCLVPISMLIDYLG
jgi:hypothetical protein